MAVNQWQQYWGLDPQITFLNHGSHGACPLPVLAVQQKLRTQLEQEPVRFFMREFEGLLDQARSHLSHFVQVDPADMFFSPMPLPGFINSHFRTYELKNGIKKAFFSKFLNDRIRLLAFIDRAVLP